MNERTFYRCEVCGNIVGMVWDGGGELICCAQPMVKLVPNSTDASREKHIPVWEREGDKLKVHVGEQTHPMTPEHWIQWIAVEEPNSTQRAILDPGDEPHAEFDIKSDDFTVYAYCNLHGLWASGTK